MLQRLQLTGAVGIALVRNAEADDPSREIMNRPDSKTPSLRLAQLR
ncbi:hypothetical protein ACV22Y_27710 [Burkholderia sp. AW50-3]